VIDGLQRQLDAVACGQVTMSSSVLRSENGPAL